MNQPKIRCELYKLFVSCMRRNFLKRRICEIYYPRNIHPVRYANTQIDTKTMLIIISYHYCHHRLHSLCITKRKCLLNIPLDQAKLSISYTQTHAGLHTCGRGFAIVRGCLLKGRGLSSSSYVHVHIQVFKKDNVAISS